MLLIKLAFRNLFRQRRRSILTLLTMVIGFFFLSISIGLSEGSYMRIIQMFTSQKTAHVQIHFEDYLNRPTIYKTLDEESLEKLKDIDFIKAYAPRIHVQALVFSKDKALGAQVIGIDLRKEFETTTLKKRLSKGEFTSHGAVITYSLAKSLKLKINDELVLISQGADGSISNDIFIITGIIGSEKDSKEPLFCYLELSTMQDFLALGNKFHEIAIMTDSYSKAPLYAKKIKALLKQIPKLDIQPWQVVEKSFYEAMQADIKGMWYSLSIVMLIVAIGVLNTVLMAVLERTREYGIMKALGTTPFLLFIQITTEIFLLSIFAVIIGSVISFVAHILLTVYGIPLTTPIEYGGMRFTLYQSIMSFDTYWIPALLIVITAVIVSIFPAISSARKKPIEAIRYV